MGEPVSQVAIPGWVREHAPDAAPHLLRAETLAATVVDPAVLELARLRIATLLRNRAALAVRSPQAASAGLTEEKIAAIAQ